MTISELCKRSLATGHLDKTPGPTTLGAPETIQAKRAQIAMEIVLIGGLREDDPIAKVTFTVNKKPPGCLKEDTNLLPNVSGLLTCI